MKPYSQMTLPELEAELLAVRAEQAQGGAGSEGHGLATTYKNHRGTNRGSPFREP